MTEAPLEDLLARLDRERQKADAAYNDALTALDRAIQQSPVLPRAPASFDATRVPDINAQWNILPGAPPPADRSIKGRLRSFVWRVVGPPLEAQKQFNAALVDHINRTTANGQQIPESIAAVVEAIREQGEALARFESLLVQYLQTITAYVDTKDRSAGGGELRQRLALIEQRVLALKRALETMPIATTSGTGAGDVTASRPAAGTQAATAPVFGLPVDAPTYVGFEDRFRGPQSEIRRRVEDYLPILKEVAEVVDIGCGRGELLELLARDGIEVIGVEPDPGMAAEARARGITVHEQLASDYLATVPDGSLGAVISTHVVEHLPLDALVDFLEKSAQKLRPGGVFIAETPNPATLIVLGSHFIMDPTHVWPLHPDLLSFLAESAGFRQVRAEFFSPADTLHLPLGDGSDAADPALSRRVDEGFTRLNHVLFGPQDYALFATGGTGLLDDAEPPAAEAPAPDGEAVS